VTVGHTNDSRKELAVAATLPAPEPSIEGPALRAPSLGDMADVAERNRVFETLFQVPVAQQQLGSYVVLGILGRGAMGTVLKAFDRTLDRHVAVKIVHRELSNQYRLRFLREARALAKLSHPNVVQVYEVGAVERQTFIVMELVRGRSLAEWLEQEPRPGWRECMQTYLQAGEGLAAAHAAGLVHRDFKPHNVMIDDQGRVRVLDFGLAREEAVAELGDSEVHASTGTDLRLDAPALFSSLTGTGAVLGTPAYMALEQMNGQEADARSDQFSFCVSLWEALYGQRPFEGKSMEALIVALQVGRIRPAPKGTAVPEALRKLLLRGLSTDPAERWPSMGALIVELRRLVASRRQAWWAASVVAGLAAAVWGLSHYAAEGPCEGATAQLEGIWDEARKREVEDAILGTGVSYAPDTWVRVEQQLDEYAIAWADKHTEVCEATSVRGEQSSEVMDLRMTCLRERRVALQETVTLLAQGDAKRVEKAVELVASLPGLSRCDEAEALASELPPPEDPRIATEVEALRDQLVRVRAMEMAGDGLREAEEIVARAEGLGYRPLLAEALLIRSRRRAAMGRYTDAEQDAERAYLLAQELGHVALAADAADHLFYYAGVFSFRYEASLQWSKTALALARDRRLEPGVEARALFDIGNVFHAREKYEEALGYFQDALAIWEEAVGPRHRFVADVLLQIGSVLARQGKLDDALTHHRRALDIKEATLGPLHPDVARVLVLTGDVLHAQGRHDEAMTHYQRAMTILDAARGRELSIAAVLTSMGALMRAEGKLSEALTHHQRALAIRESVSEPGDESLAASLADIGDVLQAQGKLAEALLHQRRALAIREAIPDARARPFIALSLDAIGDVLKAQGELSEALTHHQRALTIREDMFGPRHKDVGFSLAKVGVILEQQGKLAEALECFQRALDIFRESLGPRHPTVPATLAGIGFLLARQERGEEARAYHRRALAVFDDAMRDRNPAVAHSLARAMKAALEEHDHDMAREYGERAMSACTSSETCATLFPDGMPRLDELEAADQDEERQRR
jgi:tetratricopeptide (TPR) repeat protein/tRNA A-37 threonylcarbamoyl transferase component Bud32